VYDTALVAAAATRAVLFGIPLNNAFWPVQFA
jgi:hypothetical protein